MRKFLYAGVIFLVLLFVLYLLFYVPKLNEIKHSLYLEKALQMKELLNAEIKNKQNKTINLAYLISKDLNVINSLDKYDNSTIDYKEVIGNLRNFTEYNNISIQIIDKDGKSFYRSWKSDRGDSLLSYRHDIKYLINYPKTFQSITSGLYDLTINSISPVYKGNTLLGFVELCTKFNSVASILKNQDIDPIFVLDKESSEKIKYPFSQIYIDGHYVANAKASKYLIHLINKIGMEKFKTAEDYLIIDKHLVAIETIKDTNLKKNIGSYLLFYDLDRVNLSEVKDFELFSLLSIAFFIVIYIIVFMYYLKTSYARELDKRVQEQTFQVKEQKKKLNSLLEIYDENVIFSKTDLKGIITHASNAFCRISGYERYELIGKPHNIVRHPDMPKEVFAKLWETIKSGKKITLEIKNLKKDGSYYWVIADIEPEYDENGKHIGYFAVREDITATKEIEEIQREIIFTMGSIAEFKSKETGEHIKRVAKYSKILATHYGLNEEDIHLLTMASPMHDIGKIAVPDSILNKPGKLTDEEFLVIKSHAQKGYEMLHVSDRPIFKAAAQIALTHHEKYDGTGYPIGLHGEEIPIFGRITALADVFDALASDRCYKKAWPLENVLEFIKAEKGKHFDPKLVDIFFDNLDKILEIKEKYKDI